MQNEIVKKPMVDILSEMTGEQVVMDGEKYIALKDGADIGDDFIADAIAKQEELFNNDVLIRFKAEVQRALDATNNTMTRITQGAVLGTCSYSNSDVVAFVQYINALRALLGATEVVALPPKPPYPAGT